jgi:hypothetical protein
MTVPFRVTSSPASSAAGLTLRSRTGRSAFAVELLRPGAPNVGYWWSMSLVTGWASVTSPSLTTV